jgi:hypothetical protein
MIDYAKVLRIINASDEPAEALSAFVAQERENAVFTAMMMSDADLPRRSRN